MLPTCPWELQITPKSDPGDPKSQKKSFESASAFETWPGGLREAPSINISNDRFRGTSQRSLETQCIADRCFML